MENNKPYRLGAHAFIIDEYNKFLVIQKNNYSDSDWTVIGGGREEEESAEENLFREILEETNLEKSNYLIVGESKFKQEYDYPEDIAPKIHNGKYRGQSYTQFVVRFIGDKDAMKFNEEIRTHKWIDYSDLESHLSFPGQLEIAQKVIGDVIPDITE